jgi:hypothetical protein
MMELLTLDDELATWCVMRHLQQRVYLLHSHYVIVGTVLVMPTRFVIGCILCW